MDTRANVIFPFPTRNTLNGEICPEYQNFQFKPKFGTYNPMQNIWNKLEKSSKTGQDKKRLISIFVCFLTATAKV